MKRRDFIMSVGLPRYGVAGRREGARHCGANRGAFDRRQGRRIIAGNGALHRKQSD